MVNRLVHRDQSKIYLKQATEELIDGDQMQASEKGWGAAAQMIKAVADVRGWSHGSHWLLSEAVSKIVDETGDADIARYYREASALHANFYEGWLTEDLVEGGLDGVTRFIEKLEALLDGGQ